MPSQIQQLETKPTCVTLHQHHQHLQQLIYSLQNKLQLLVEQYWMTLSKNQQDKQKLFNQSYYINQLIGYIKQQKSLSLHYQSYLRDFQPQPQFTYRTFYDYLQDQSLKLKCQQKLHQSFYRNLWLKQLEYLKKQYLKNNNLHSQTIKQYLTSQTQKQSINKNPQQYQQQLQLIDMKNQQQEQLMMTKQQNNYNNNQYNDDEIVGGMR